MKLIIRIIFIGTLTYFLSPILPWWTGMAAAFIVCYVSPSSLLNAFVAGFLGAGLIWLGMAWTMDVANESVFTQKIAELLTVNDPAYVILATGLIGGLSAGLAGATGSSARQLFKKQQRSGYYS